MSLYVTPQEILCLLVVPQSHSVIYRLQNTSKQFLNKQFQPGLRKSARPIYSLKNHRNRPTYAQDVHLHTTQPTLCMLYMPL
jgi:hypothetical protein